MWQLAWFIVKLIILVYLILLAIPFAIAIVGGIISWIVECFNKNKDNK